MLHGVEEVLGIFGEIDHLDLLHMAAVCWKAGKTEVICLHGGLRLRRLAGHPPWRLILRA